MTGGKPPWLKPPYLARRETLRRAVVLSARQLREQGYSLLDVLLILRKTITEMAAAQAVPAVVLETVLAEISVWAVSEFYGFEP